MKNGPALVILTAPDNDFLKVAYGHVWWIEGKMDLKEVAAEVAGDGETYTHIMVVRHDEVIVEQPL